MDIANIAAFEIDDEVLANLREYALANSLYWALAEGHACEISVSIESWKIHKSATNQNILGPPQCYGCKF